jgi:dihydroorotase
MISVDLPVPDDWHVHLRDDEMLAAVVDYTAEWFRYALVMPNLTPPISTTRAAAEYRQRILAAATLGGGIFEPLMSLYLTDSLSADDLRVGWSEGAVSAVKFYPAGATTNSESGGERLLDFGPVLAVMAELGVPLLIHAESTDPSIDIFDREAAFLEGQVGPLLEQMPELSVTVEHISTAAGVNIVNQFPQAYGSITPHHLACDRSDLLANGMRPELYCKPVINSSEHRQALVAAATSGSPKFFLGTDSAPHPLSQKEVRVAKAGIFNAPYGLQVTAEVFHQNAALDVFADFVSRRGAERYGYPPSGSLLRMERTETPSLAPAETITTASGEEVRLFGVAEAAAWSISRI